MLEARIRVYGCVQEHDVESDTEHAQRVPGAEQGGVPPTQVKLKERQKFFEEAFQQDMEQYLSTGYLQITERRGPDVESFTAEISLQVPTQAELRHKLSSLSSTCTDSASQDTEAGEEEEEEEEEEQEEEEERGGGVVGSRRRRPPVVVTLDEEEVHVDTALLDRAEEQSSTDCEENRPKD
ncbi:hypothetical protein fugu_018218 [Takifugu bimaculatus]|uniref:Uncharacterized protein n=1 Tax=Takifugu bimaculatus TaxID=433685 RepID=A0A4Z2BMK4_9TELE|nr:hypothetical protein fugu_018218 [Takifugu bimaculatus]